MHAVIGVDPHKRIPTAVALDGRGGRLGQWNGSTTRQGLKAVRAWAAGCAPGASWAIEGSNFLGRRLALALAEAGADVREVCATRTAARRRQHPGRGTSDAVDAAAVARELLAPPTCPAPSRLSPRARRTRRATRSPCSSAPAPRWSTATGAS
jgi:hypothetical protein